MRFLRSIGVSRIFGGSWISCGVLLALLVIADAGQGPI